MNASNLRTAGIATATLALAVGAGLATASPASAHATTQLYGATATQGGYGAMFIRIPHGCEGERTLVVKVNLPATFTSGRPQAIAGWKAQTRVHADGSRTLIWASTGNGLRDDQFMDFGVSVKWPSAKGTYYIPTVQKCRTKSVAWNEIPQQGQPEPEHPAPSVVVHKGTSAHH